MAKLGIPEAACFIASIGAAAYVVVNGASWWWPVIFIFVGLLVLTMSTEAGKKEEK